MEALARLQEGQLRGWGCVFSFWGYWPGEMQLITRDVFTRPPLTFNLLSQLGSWQQPHTAGLLSVRALTCTAGVAAEGCGQPRG